MADVTIGDGFELKKATYPLFEREYALYVPMRENRWFRQTYEEMVGMVASAREVAWFIFHEGRQVGGLIWAGGTVAHPYMRPGSEGMEARFLAAIDAHLAASGTPEMVVQLGRSGQRAALEAMGYEVCAADVCMIRPTEQQNPALHLPAGFATTTPSPDLVEAMASLVWACNESVSHATMLRSLEAARDEMAAFFRAQDEAGACLRASRLLWTSDGELAAVCLMAMHEGLPIVFEVCVHPTKRCQGLASMLLLAAASDLAEAYPAVRLYVAADNPAQRLYRNLGWMAAETSYVMRRQLSA